MVEVHSSGPNAYHIEVPRDQDPRPEIARLVVEKGWRLLTLQNLSMKLEDIFLQVVTKERLAQAQDAQAEEPIREEVGGPV